MHPGTSERRTGGPRRLLGVASSGYYEWLQQPISNRAQEDAFYNRTRRHSHLEMRKSRFTESRIVGVLKEAEAGVPISELVRKHGISRNTYFNWKARYSGAEISELRRLGRRSRGECRSPYPRPRSSSSYRRNLFKLSDVEPVMAVVARSDADEWQSIVAYDRGQEG